MARTFRRRFTRRRRYGRTRRRGAFRTKRSRTTFKRRGRSYTGRRRRTYRRYRGRRSRFTKRVSKHIASTPYYSNRDKTRKRLQIQVRCNVLTPPDAILSFPLSPVPDSTVIDSKLRTNSNILSVVSLLDFQSGNIANVGPITGPDIASYDNKGTLLFFNVFTYVRAVYALWRSYRGSFAVDDAHTAGDTDQHPTERMFRYFMDSTRFHTTKSMSLTLVRRTGKMLRSSQPLTTYREDDVNDGITYTDGTRWHHPHRVESFTPKGDVPFYSYLIDGSHSSTTLMNDLYNGQATFGNAATGTMYDSINGTTVDAQARRLSRMMSEMITPGSGWVKHDGRSSIKLKLNNKAGSDALVALTCTSESGANGAFQRYASGSFDNFSYAENDIVFLQEKFYDANKSVSNRFMAPGRVFPRGTIVLWCPYDIIDLEANYDFYINGVMLFKSKGRGVFDRRMKDANSYEV